MKLPTNWAISAEDAAFSLIHIRTHELQKYNIGHAECPEEHHETIIDLPTEWNECSQCPYQTPICVPQGANLALGVLIRPKGDIQTYNSWYSKYKELEVTTHVPRYDDDTPFNLPERVDILASDAKSRKHTLLGTESHPYIIHITIATLVVHENMVDKTLPLIAYIIPKADFGSQTTPFHLVGEVMVKEILQINTSHKESLVLIMLSNNDVKQDIEIEDAHITCVERKKPDVAMPFTLHSGNKTNLLFKISRVTHEMTNDNINVIIKWHVKGQPLGIESIWTTMLLHYKAANVSSNICR